MTPTHPRPRPRRRSLGLSCLMVAASAAAACGPGQGESPTPAASSPSPSSPAATATFGDPCAQPEGAPDVALVVDLDAVRFTTGRLIGWNMGAGTLYAPEGDPLHPEWRTPEATASYALLGQVRALDAAPLLRFSGLQIDGSLGQDGYHFWDFADPQHTPAEGDNVAPFQYMAAIDEAGGEPVVMVNFGSGTAAEAAAYLTHLVGEDADDPRVAARASFGHPAPWAPAFYEVGNESYGFWNTGYLRGGEHSYANPQAVGGGDPGWYGKPSSDPGDYAARAVAYADAMAAADPSARLFIPVSQSLMEAWGGLDDAIPALAPILAHPATAAAVIHQYLVDDVLVRGHMDVNSVPLILGGVEYYRPGFTALMERLAALPRPLPVAVTEYHVAGAFAVGFELSDAAVLGLGAASMLMFYADLGVGFALQHMAIGFPEGGGPGLFEVWYNPFRAVGGGEIRPMPTWATARLIADHLLEETATVTAEIMPLERYPVGEDTLSYPLVQAVAFVDHAGSRGTALLLNRRLDGGTLTQLRLPSGWSAESATTWAPPSPEVNALEVDIEEQGLSVTALRGGAQLNLPPHSLTAVTFGRGGCDEP